MEKLNRKIQIQKKARKISSQKIGLECGWGCVLGLGGGLGANFREIGRADWREFGRGLELELGGSSGEVGRVGGWSWELELGGSSGEVGRGWGLGLGAGIGREFCGGWERLGLELGAGIGREFWGGWERLGTGIGSWMWEGVLWRLEVDWDWLVGAWLDHRASGMD
jgi:hypothetical protein